MSDILAMLRRRWILSLVAALLALGAGFGLASRAGVTYTYVSTVLLLPPEVRLVDEDSGMYDFTRGNPLFYLGSLDQTRDILIGALSARDVQQDIGERFPSTGYTVSSDILASGPVLVISVSGSSEEEAAAALDHLGTVVPETLTKLQAGVGVARPAQITMHPLTTDQEPGISHKAQIRGAIAGAGGAGVVLLLLIGLVDNLKRASEGERSGRRAHAEPVPEPEPEPQATTPARRPRQPEMAERGRG